MRKAISVLCLSVLAASVSAHTSNDVRGLYINESSVGNLSKSAPVRYSKSGSASLSSAQRSDSVADVVVFYQPSYFAKYGEYEAHKRIAEWVKVTNDSYQSHGLDYRLSVSDVVAVESISDDVPYQDVVDENGTIITDGANYLFSLLTLNEGSPEYSIYQDKWKGDLVVYVREQRPEDAVLGLAGIGGEFSSVLDDGRTPETYTTFAHEIGHNIGMNHEEAKAFVGPEYARAWSCGGKFTIMYSASSASSTLHHYSSPDKSNAGQACGDESVADNARILKENFVATTQRREGVTSLGEVSFVSSAYSGDEENGVKVVIQRDGDLTQSASVKLFAENVTAEWGVDYTNAFVIAEFEEGSATSEVNFPIVNDGESEGVETLTLSMQFPYKLSVGDAAVATLHVANGAQNGGAGVFSISGTSEINEGDQSNYVVTRVGGVGEAVVNVKAVSGSALSGADFVELNEQLVFGENEVEKTVTFSTIDDLVSEPIEKLGVEISSPNDSAEYDVESIEVNIIDNDTSVEPNIGKFTLSVTASTVSESVGSVTFKISRNEGFDGQAVLRAYATSGTAISGTDFVAFDENITFNDGEVEKSFTIQILDDSIDESGSNSFDVKLEGDGLDISNGNVTITITDNDNSTTGGENESSSSGGGSTGFGFVLLLGLMTIFRNSGLYANKKSI